MFVLFTRTTLAIYCLQKRQRLFFNCATPVLNDRKNFFK